MAGEDLRRCCPLRGRLFRVYCCRGYGSWYWSTANGELAELGGAARFLGVGDATQAPRVLVLYGDGLRRFGEGVASPLG